MSESKVKSWLYTTTLYPDTLKLGESTLPAAPKPNHVFIQVRAAALNPVDIQMMNLPLNNIPGLNGPKIPARDFSGTILAAADGTGFEQGDEVMGISTASDGSGGLTEVAHLDVQKACIVKKPNRMSWTQAASLPLVWLTARTSIERCVPYLKQSNPADNKLVVLGGSSSTGLYTVRIAKERGWTVLSSCSSRNTDFVRSMGASQMVDYTSAPDAVTTAVSKFKPHAIIDCVGGTECIGLAPQYVTIVGDKTSRSTMGGSFLYYTRPWMVWRWLLGRIGFGHSYECIILDLNKDWLEECTKLKGEDQIIIDSTFDFSRVKEAYERLDTSRARGKVVVELKQ
jgi:reticulon-4-interacting protein 1, mitochondrial